MRVTVRKERRNPLDSDIIDTFTTIRESLVYRIVKGKLKEKPYFYETSAFVKPDSSGH